MPRWQPLGYPSVTEFLPLEEPPDVATRRHPAVLIGPILLLIVPVLVVRWIDDRATVTTLDGWLLPLLASVPVAIGLHQIAVWTCGWFIVTRGRVLLFSGFLGHTKAVMPVQRVTDVETSRPIPRTLLGYCHVKIESAGQDQALHTVRFLARPAQVSLVMDLITNRPLPPFEELGPPVPLESVEEPSLPGGLLLLIILVGLAIVVAVLLG